MPGLEDILRVLLGALRPAPLPVPIPIPVHDRRR